MTNSDLTKMYYRVSNNFTCVLTFYRQYSNNNLFLMNKTLSVLSLALLLAACGKNDAPIPTKTYAGQWKLVEQSGGIAGWTTRISADTVILLTLRNDNTYSRQFNGRVLNQGSYQIDVRSSSFIDATGSAITFDHHGQWQFISVKADTLWLADPYPDGFSLSYVRMN